MGIETIRHTLKSNTGKSVEVPQECNKRAEKLVKIVLDSKTPTELYNNIKKDFYLRYSNIMQRADQLVRLEEGDPERLKLEDEVYIKACIKGVEQKYGSSESEARVILYLLNVAAEEVQFSRRKK